MTPRLRIESLGVYLPENLASTAEVLRPCRGVPAFLFERCTGIRRRPVVGPEEFSIHLARKAVAECLRSSRFTPESLDLLVCCNISHCDGPDGTVSLEPTTALTLKHEFGCSRALAFDISNACAGVFTGLYVVEAFLRSGAARRAMVVSGEHTTHLYRAACLEIRGRTDPRLACLTLADSGLALTLEATDRPGEGFEALDLRTFGEYSRLCVAQRTDREHGGAIMHTESGPLTQAALAHCGPLLAWGLRSHGWDPHSVDVLIAHQTAKLALDRARTAWNRALGATWLHKGNFVNNLADRGNLATNTHFVALKDWIDQDRIRSGNRVVFSIAASGLTAGTALYSLGDLPDRLRGRGRREPTRDSRPAFPGDGPDVAVRIESAGIAPGLPSQRGMIESAKLAVEACFRNSGYDREDVDLILYAGTFRDRQLCEPALAALLAGECRFRHTSRPPGTPALLAFDLLSGAVGFLKACYVAARLIEAGRARVALVLTSENEENPVRVAGPHRPIAHTGAAMLLDRGPGPAPGLGRFRFRSYTEYLGLRTVRTGRHPTLQVHNHPRLDDISLRLVADCLARDYPPDLLRAARTRVILLPPGMDRDRARALAATLRLRDEQVLTAADPDVDLFTSSFACAWLDLRHSGRVVPGDRGLFVTVGAGMEVGCAVYQF